MYDVCNSSSTLLDDRRHQMSLDFAAAQRKCFYPVASSTHGKVATSPDLEAFLLYASAGGSTAGESDLGDSTTGTPTQILFPNAVTAEQEAYARGFVDALEELHRQQGVPAASAPAQSTVRTQSTPCSADVKCWSSDAPYQLSSTSGHGHASSVSSPGSNVGGPTEAGRVTSSLVDADRRCRQSAADDGVQMVPRLSCLTPPSSPDVDAVELARIDRKRERNRLAAQKCRSRKLEQIVVLESRCAVLRAENDGLSRTAEQLADQVRELQQTLAEHTASPQCFINTSSAASSL